MGGCSIRGALSYIALDLGVGSILLIRGHGGNFWLGKDVRGSVCITPVAAHLHDCQDSGGLVSSYWGFFLVWVG